MKKLISLLAALAAALLPLPGLAEAAEAAAEVPAQGIHLDGGAFVDSLQYMLKGMVGIFLVTGLIILTVVILEKVTGKKQDQEE